MRRQPVESGEIFGALPLPALGWHERADRMTDPRLLGGERVRIALQTRVDAQRAHARVLALADAYLKLHRTLRGQRQRLLQGQLLHRLASELSARVQSQLEQRRAR